MKDEAKKAGDAAGTAVTGKTGTELDNAALDQVSGGLTVTLVDVQITKIPVSGGGGTDPIKN
jgi:hypothetical protein